MVRKHTRHGALFLGLAVLAAACGDSPTEPEPEPFDVNDVEFADELDVTVGDLEETASGLFVYDVALGEGPQPDSEGTVDVHLTLWLPDGTLLGDTRPDNPESIDLADQDLISGFEEGLLGMNEGGTRILVLPPDLAYGETGNGPIPPNSGVVFRLELLSVTPSSS